MQFLESDECLEEVETMMNEARRKGINGVPFVVIDGRWAVSGGQTAEVYSQVRRCPRRVVLASFLQVWLFPPDLQKARIG